jgi:formylglycine-generating enzyme required for sulfatase activity
VSDTPFSSSERRLVSAIAERIRRHAARSVSFPEPYESRIPATTVSFRLAAVREGEFLMGSDASDPYGKPDEMPQRRVAVAPFWMQTHPVTWDEYHLFLFDAMEGASMEGGDPLDGLAHPTRPYLDMSFGMGIHGYPAISMTQHAANKYAQWLSAKTGEFYRLPTEAEWEYACRAGTGSAFYFGSDESLLDEYAWFAGNSGGTYHKVATRKPNPWGLFDMLGNVLEWTLDQYAPYLPGRIESWVKPTAPYPISVRGGCWADEARDVRCAARVASDPAWKHRDPQVPKSIWYESDAPWLGFRLIRPRDVPSEEEMLAYWNCAVLDDGAAV